MPLLYRASRAPMTLGENSSSVCEFSDNPERQKLEEFFESKRPSTSYSPVASWFMCDDPAKSARYLEAEIAWKPSTDSPGERILYSVESTEFSRQPMVLVEATRKALAEDDIEKAERLATEYWTPTRDWSFWEYTSPKIVVVEGLPWPNCMQQSLAFMSYQGDSKRVNEFLGSF